jgi:hypothetical protein
LNDAADFAAKVLPKNVLSSLTMWGGVLGFVATVLPPILTATGYGAASTVQTVVMGVISSAMVFIGRMKAAQPLSFSA